MNKKELFKKLIKIIDKNNIPYALVGRTECYPENIGSDIDIIIPRSEIKTFKQVIWQIEDNQTKIVQMLQHEIVAFYYVLFHFDNGDIVSIQPDVCTDYYRKGRKLLSADYLLEGRKDAVQGGFHVLTPEKEFIYYLLKKVDKRNLSEEQYEHIRTSYLINKDKALLEAKEFWKGENLLVIQKSMDENNFLLLHNNLRKLQQGIHSSHSRKTTDILKNIALKIKRILNPTGYIITVLGPDGSGKTTVMEQFKKDIKPAFRRLQQFHLFPKPHKGATKVVEDPHGQKKRNLILSLLKLIYLLYIYIGGHLRYVLPMKIKSTLTIFDRYYDDILVDPIRYRNDTPCWIVRFIRCFIPKPELWVILDCPTEVIQARKAEVTPAETERQRQAYLSLAKSKKNCIVLNTNRDVKEISYELCLFICKSLNERSIKRYK
ncbi:hypothetical protein [Xylanibacter muris]|uniref:Thymidylate kinase-like domain-containing protein n=1 Tax=Xylanibacter muris TaxID=2736290 RepID=A0ABX2ASK7_9BACT|nr:hypothetical protein [Xylanibacter muris]NPD92936.1 hypothetical protein [Xylanibacter muris]